MTNSTVSQNSNRKRAGAAIAALILLAVGFWFLVRDPATAPQTTTSVTQPAPTVPVQTAPTPQATPAPPRFDEVRRELDGTTIIAGRAAPGSDVAVIVNGQEIARATADASGAVAALANLPDFDAVQVFELLQTDPQGAQTPSADTVILAPLPQVAIVPTPAVPTPAVPSDEPETADTPAKAAEQTPRVAVLKSTPDGVDLVDTVAPKVVDNLELDTISYSIDGDVQLAGRAQSQARQVRVYLDNAQITTLQVDETGRWRGNLPEVDEGIYTLRVDELDQEGTVTSRVETPFKRESPAVLAAAAGDTDLAAKAITVQTGATLWAIARDRYGDGTLYVRVVEANSTTIRNPDLIYPGQVFDLPD